MVHPGGSDDGVFGMAATASAVVAATTNSTENQLPGHQMPDLLRNLLTV